MSEYQTLGTDDEHESVHDDDILIQNEESSSGSSGSSSTKEDTTTTSASASGTEGISVEVEVAGRDINESQPFQTANMAATASSSGSGSGSGSGSSYSHEEEKKEEMGTDTDTEMALGSLLEGQVAQESQKLDPEEQTTDSNRDKLAEPSMRFSMGARDPSTQSALRVTPESSFRSRNNNSANVAKNSFRSNTSGNANNNSNDANNSVPPSPTRLEKSKIEEALEDKFLSSVNGLVALGLCIGLLICGLVIGVTLGFVKPWEDNDIAKAPSLPSPAPSSSFAPTPMPPTFAPVTLTPEDQILLDLFASVVGDSVYSPGTPHYEAGRWILYRDPLTNGDDNSSEELGDEEYIQRYLMVYFYYATSNVAKNPWLSCNPPPLPGLLPNSDNCLYLKPTGINPADGSLTYTEVPWIRWLTGEHECDWAGVSCITLDNNGLSVTGIELAGQMLVGSLMTEIMELPDLASLLLPHNDLLGTLFEEFQTLDNLDLSYNLITGTLVPTLGKLETLQLQHNTLRGTLPDEFFEYTTPLRRVNLGANLMNGTIPETISFALKLTELSLYDNTFTGSLPNELGQLPLQVLRLGQNNLVGSLPFDTINVAWLVSLETLWLNDNRFSGTIPAILGSAPRMQDLRVSNNNLVGGIPESIFNLVRLFRLEVSDNRLTGTISPRAAQLTALEVLSLHSNRLTGSMDDLESLLNLQQLQLQFNTFTGSVPQALCRFAGDTLEILRADCLPLANPLNPCSCCTECCNRDTQVCVTVDDNPGGGGDGDGPTTEVSDVRDWARIVFGSSIDVNNGSPHDNTIRWIANEDSLQLTLNSPRFLQRYVTALFYHLTGPWLSCNPGTANNCLFQELAVENDEVVGYDGRVATRWLAGTLECEWAGIECTTVGQVKSIQLLGQDLTGVIPTELVLLPNLETIALGYNSLTGTVPRSIGGIPNLRSFQLQRNLLTGSIPTTFFADTLEVFNVAENSLIGQLPQDLGGATSLQEFSVTKNNLEGSIPLNAIERLVSLKVLRLNDNMFEGTLPTGLFLVSSSLVEAWLQGNQFAGSLPTEFGLLTQLTDLRLTSNQFTGEIPAELYKLVELRILYLDDNALVGKLSPEAGSLELLEQFRVSRNDLSGTIPSELGMLLNLELAWFHVNQLTGRMPNDVCNLIFEELAFLQADCEEEIVCVCCTACCDSSFVCSENEP